MYRKPPTVARLRWSSVAGPGEFGESVSISGETEGKTYALIGGPSDNNRAGAAWVFTRSGGVWSQQGSKLVGTGAVGVAGPRSLA